MRHMTRAASKAAPARVLIIGYVWPEPTSSAAGLRDIQLVDAFQRDGWEVLFSSPSKFNSFSQKLEARGVRIASLEPNDPAFDSWLLEQRPDVVVFDRFVTEEQFGWRVHEQLPDALRIVDTQDLHFLRRARMKALKDGSAEPELMTEDALREIASIYRSDLSWVLSDHELALLRERFRVPEPLVALSRMSYPARPLASPSFEDRRNFVMIGNFRHPPNHDGVFWFQREIWPAIRKRLPEAEAHLYGAYPPKEIMALDDPKKGFRVLGWAEDQYAALRKYRVNLAPLRFGAGIKGKIADGWWCGTPVVTTPVGAEGMSGTLPFGGEVALSAAELAERAVALYEGQERWADARQAGFRILDELYDFERNSDRLLAGIRELWDRKQAHRAENFVGAMLWHHQHKSTKYFSRWIEAKNRPFTGSSSVAQTLSAPAGDKAGNRSGTDQK